MTKTELLTLLAEAKEFLEGVQTKTEADPMPMPWPIIDKIEQALAGEGPEQFYDITWKIDVTARSPLEAAMKALEIQRNGESSALVFGVSRDGQEWLFDLERPAREADISNH